ncbi:hypothetical protein [Amphritea sp. HPY]
MQRRHVEVLKGRSGEIGEFNINWDFHKMSFNQWVDLMWNH